MPAERVTSERVEKSAPERSKNYYVFSEGKFEETEINSAFFGSHPILWSARLSTGVFGLTSCPSGNSPRAPKNAGEVVLGVGDEGLTALVKLGFIPCPVCNPESSPHFSWSAIGGVVSTKYEVISAAEFADKTRVPFDARRLNWELIVSTVHGAPSRIYLPEGLDYKEVESFRSSIRQIVRADGVAKEPVLGYYDRKVDGHFTEYVLQNGEAAKLQADPKFVAEARATLLPNTAQKKIYFAHAQPVYGTEEERINLVAIGQRFENYFIVNPAAVKDYHIRDMDFYLGVVDECDDIVFTRFHGVVMGGVGKEIEEAIKKGIPAHELSETGIAEVKKVPEYLSREETVAMLIKVGFRKA
ncbi:MAG: hypothetical protein KGH57_02430 [Candidatus Micrarchaeota archaeon]|nr:hypothetical protein [Candidatus Micrarchaeota archaeon]